MKQTMFWVPVALSLTNILMNLLQILSDTKELQKEINNLTGKLDRTFAVTDELVFKVAGWTLPSVGNV